MRILRYWGSHFKSQCQVGVVVEEFRPLIQRGWDCHLVLEREPSDAEWLAALKKLSVSVHIEPRPRSKADPLAILGCSGFVCVSGLMSFSVRIFMTVL